MTFEIKIKAGFFKTRLYFLSITKGQLILTPREESDDGRLVVEFSDLKSICIIRKDQVSGELEIVTANGIMIGNFAPHTNLEEVSQELSREFGRKFTGVF